MGSSLFSLRKPGKSHGGKKATEKVAMKTGTNTTTADHAKTTDRTNCGDEERQAYSALQTGIQQTETWAARTALSLAVSW